MEEPGRGLRDELPAEKDDDPEAGAEERSKDGASSASHLLGRVQINVSRSQGDVVLAR